MNLSLHTSDNHTLPDSLGAYAFLFFLCAGFSLFSPHFANWENFLNILLATSVIGLLSAAAALVIASGGLDLSVGSVLALSGSTAAVALHSGISWLPALILCLISGCTAGALNGFIIARLKVPAFIATLGMLSVARGIALSLTDGRPYYGLPEEIVFLGQGWVLGIPVPVIIFLFTCFCLHILLRRTVFGNRILCLGDNERAVFNAGINVTSLKVFLYLLSGLLAALAGVIFIARMNAADPSAGLSYELTAITAAILGGTRISGGKASIVGALVGALIMGVLQNGLTLLAVPTYYQQIAVGAVLILALSIEKILSKES